MVGPVSYEISFGVPFEILPSKQHSQNPRYLTLSSRISVGISSSKDMLSPVIHFLKKAQTRFWSVNVNIFVLKVTPYKIMEFHID